MIVSFFPFQEFHAYFKNVYKLVLFTPYTIGSQVLVPVQWLNNS
jgi:hypothetical protein